MVLESGKFTPKIKLEVKIAKWPIDFLLNSINFQYKLIIEPKLLGKGTSFFVIFAAFYSHNQTKRRTTYGFFRSKKC